MFTCQVLFKTSIDVFFTNQFPGITWFTDLRLYLERDGLQFNSQEHGKHQ